MAVTVAEVGPTALTPLLASVGNFRVTVKDVTFDNSYPTGGEPITAESVNLRRIRFGICSTKVPTAVAAGANAEIVCLPQTDGTALLRVNTAAAEVANTTDLSALVGQCVFFGDA
jgi:hypothetical protein